MDNCTGFDFAQQLSTVMLSKGMKKNKVSVIQANPEQSKHLETACVKIFDNWVDLVNLRSETYNTDSRIPEMAFGTPEEDASRRDFTVNAMFYNINERKVEDFTGRGMPGRGSRDVVGS